MRKTTVVALGLTLVLLVIFCLTGCNDKLSPDVSTPAASTKSVVVPGHHWTMSMTEKQLDLLKNCWGSEMTILELTTLLWPEVVNFLPEHMVHCWSENKLYWSTSELSNLINSSIHYMSFLELMRGIPFEDSYRMYFFYIGLVEPEVNSMRVDDSLNVVPENVYRVSLYTDNILDKKKGRLQSSFF
jgi:hypothetical protein